MRLKLGFSILNTSFPLVKRLIGFNKNYSSLKGLRELANLGLDDFIIKDSFGIRLKWHELDEGGK